MWLFLLSLSPLCMIWAFCAVLQALPAARLSVLLMALPRLFPDHLQPVSLPDALATEQQRWGAGEAGDHRAPGWSAESPVPAVLSRSSWKWNPRDCCG